MQEYIMQIAFTPIVYLTMHCHSCKWPSALFLNHRKYTKRRYMVFPLWKDAAHSKAGYRVIGTRLSV